MKVAVIGKGGSGKTTTSSVLARELARRGREVVALDCDANANLGLSLGMGVDTAEHLVSVRAPAEHASGCSNGSVAPSGIQFAVVARIENPNPGCPCCGMSPHQLLDTLDTPHRVVVADLEAGIGTLTRVGSGAIDVAVLVVEPTAKSLDVADRALELARERGVPRIVVVANRVLDETDRAFVADRFPGTEVLVVPEDEAIVAADRAGDAPFDLHPEAPAVRALVALADLLEPQPVG